MGTYLRTLFFLLVSSWYFLFIFFFADFFFLNDMGVVVYKIELTLLLPVLRLASSIFLLSLPSVKEN